MIPSFIRNASCAAILFSMVIGQLKCIELPNLVVGFVILIMIPACFASMLSLANLIEIGALGAILFVFFYANDRIGAHVEFFEILGFFTLYKFASTKKSAVFFTKFKNGISAFIILVTIFTLGFIYHLNSTSYEHSQCIDELISLPQYIDSGRFAIGNAIVTPMFITSLLICIVIYNDNSKLVNIAAISGFILAYLAGSRMIIVVNLLLILYIFRINYVGIYLAQFALLFVLSNNYILERASINYERFFINDAGSMEDRLALFSGFKEQFGLGSLDGHGLAYSPLFVEKLTGEYRGIESTVLQLILDCGFLFVMVYFVWLHMSTVAKYTITSTAIRKIIFVLMSVTYLSQVLLLADLNTFFAYAGFAAAAIKSVRFEMSRCA